MLDIKKISSSPVSIIKKSNLHNYNVSIPEFLVTKGNAKVLSVFNNKKSINYMNNFFRKNKPEILTQVLDEENAMKKSSQIVFSDYETVTKLFLDKKTESEIDFCSLIIINDIHLDEVYKTFLILLWTYIYPKTKKRPYLVMTTNCYLIPNLPFELPSLSFQEISEKKQKKVEIVYHDNNFSPNTSKIIDSLVEKIAHYDSKIPVTEDKSSTWLVFYSGIIDIKTVVRKIDRGLKTNSRVFLYSSLKSFTQLHREGKRAIVVTNYENMENIFLSPEAVFDTMIVEQKNKDCSVVYKNSSKQTSELRKNYCTEGFVYRFCTEELFESLSKIEISQFENKNLEDYFLKIINSKINPHKFFSPLLNDSEIERIMNRLSFLNLIEEENITKYGKIAIKLPLKNENVSLLMNVEKTKKPIFPFIVAVVLSELENEFIYYPKRNYNENYEDFLKRKMLFLRDHIEDESNTAFEIYLKIIHDILEKESTINIKNVKEVALKRCINYVTLDKILEKIKTIIDLYPKKVEVGTFDPENLINIISDFYEISHSEHIGTLQDENKGIYSFPDGNAYKLDFQKHPITEKKFPIKIVSFNRLRINSSRDSIQKGKNILNYYLSLTNIYIDE